MRNYSQNNEQEIILNYFGDFKGRLVDIGAYNGIDLSNTRALLELGWKGALVEPNPYNVVPLLESVRQFTNAAVFACGIGSARAGVGRLVLDDSPGRGWAATFDLSKGDGLCKRSDLLLMVPFIPAPVFFEDFLDHHVDFISIDAEYMDFDILKSIPRKSIDACRMLVIEAVERDAIRDYLTGTCGFKIHAETPENIIAAR